MPKVAMDYSKTVIYHFTCKDETIKCSYVGSTTNFNKRKWEHKKCCNLETGTGKNYRLKVYQTIREHGGWLNWDMIPLEEFPCENRTQQLIREQHWIDKLKPELNCIASYNEKTKAERHKEYYEANSEKIKEQAKEYREANSESIKKQSKEYYEANSEKLKKKRKEYYETNKDKIKEQISKKYTCECGSICSHGDKSRHEKTVKHQTFISANNKK